MFSPHTNKTYYIGTLILDLKTGKNGKVYKINVLGLKGIRVIFDDNTKKGYFGIQLSNLEIIS